MNSRFLLILTKFFILIPILYIECKSIPHHHHHHRNKTFSRDKNLKIISFDKGLDPGMSLDIVSVLNDATKIFRNILSSALSKKKIMGLESPWYWT